MGGPVSGVGLGPVWGSSSPVWGAPGGGCGCLAPWAWGLPGFTVGVRLLVVGRAVPRSGVGLVPGCGMGGAWVRRGARPARPWVRRRPALSAVLTAESGAAALSRRDPPPTPPTCARMAPAGTINTCPEAQSSLTRPPPKERRSLAGQGEQSSPPPQPRAAVPVGKA